jgi:hypothetical protein
VRTQVLSVPPVKGSATTHTMCVHVAGVTGALLLEQAGPALMDQIRARLGGYASAERAPTPEATFSLRVLFAGGLEPPPRVPGGVVRPVVSASATRITIERWDFEAVLERAFPGLVWTGHAVCRDTPYDFESLLRVLWSLLLPRAGAALMHACGVRLPDRADALLAAGPSGAGKTTLARKAPGDADVLSDEVVAVCRDGDDRWSLASTPFFGELPRTSLTPRRFPVVGIAFLEQRPQVRMTALPAGEAVFRAIECLMSWENDVAAVGRLFDLMVALTRAVPCFRCASAVDSPFAAMLAAMVPLLTDRRLPPPAGPAHAGGPS